MKIIYTDANGKTPDVNKAIENLKAAYAENNADAIATALETANATLQEANRIARADFYKSKITDDVTETRKAILAGGYIKQKKLVNRVDKKTGARVVETSDSETQIDILEVNRLTRKEIFGDDLEYRANKFRTAVVAYVASECDKSADEIEHAFGYGSLKYLAGKKTSMNEMQKLLQDTIDEIIVIPTDKGENSLLGKKSDVKTVSYWIATKAPRYGTKFSSTEGVLSMVVDIIWAKLNDLTLTMKFDKIEF